MEKERKEEEKLISNLADRLGMSTEEMLSWFREVLLGRPMTEEERSAERRALISEVAKHMNMSEAEVLWEFRKRVQERAAELTRTKQNGSEQSTEK